jgi:hypothetical protein
VRRRRRLVKIPSPPIIIISSLSEIYIVTHHSSSSYIKKFVFRSNFVVYTNTIYLIPWGQVIKHKMYIKMTSLYINNFKFKKMLRQL